MTAHSRSNLMPGPLPRYRPNFTEEFLAEARRLVQARTEAAHRRQRACLVLLLHEQPLISNVQAAAQLDLYQGYWQGERLDPFDRILSADEKTSIQARIRCHESLGPAARRRRRVEAEYERGGALQYLAAWDIQEGLAMGRCEAQTGIEP